MWTHEAYVLHQGRGIDRRTRATPPTAVPIQPKYAPPPHAHTELPTYTLKHTSLLGYLGELFYPALTRRAEDPKRPTPRDKSASYDARELRYARDLNKTT